MQKWQSEETNKTPDVVVLSGIAPDMVRRRILSVRERRDILSRLSSYEKIAGATADGHTIGTSEPGVVIPPAARFNKNKMNEQAKSLLRTLEEGTPPVPTAKEKDALFARKKEILEKLEHDQVLETRSELHVIRKDNPEYYKAVDKARMRPKYDSTINELKNICRTLEPEDEFADNLDRYRKERN